MQREAVNGFVLLDKAQENADVTMIFSCIKSDIPYLAVSLQSFASAYNSELHYDVIIMEDGFDDTDYSRIYNIVKNIQGTSVRIVSVNYEERLQFVDFDENLGYEDGIFLFLPFILKRYGNALCIKSGTILKEGFESACNRTNGNNCYVSQGKLLAVYYDLEYCRETFTVSVIADIGIHGSLQDSIKKAYTDMQFIDEDSLFIPSKNEQGKYTEEFINCAQKTIFYESLIYMEDKKFRYQPRHKAIFYLFPFEKVKQGSDIVIYGAGNVGKQYIKQINLSGYCNVVAVVDKKYEWYQLHGNRVQAPSELKDIKYDYLIVSIAGEKGMMEIQKDLDVLGVDMSKVILQSEREIYLRR